MEWQDLPLKQRHLFIRSAVMNGMKDRASIVEAYNTYAKGGYENWKQLLSAFLDVDNDNTYDYESYYNDNPVTAWEQLDRFRRNQATHFPDEFKTNIHPTNSDLSTVSDPDWLGRWDGDKNYYLSRNRAEDPDLVDETLDYVGSDTHDHDVIVHYPDGSIALPQIVVTPKESYSHLRRNKFNDGWVYSDRPKNMFGDGGGADNWDETPEGIAVNAGIGLIPIVGTMNEARLFVNNPSWEQAGWTTLSLLGDIATIFTFGAGEGIKGAISTARASRSATKTMKAYRQGVKAGKTATAAKVQTHLEKGMSRQVRRAGQRSGATLARATAIVNNGNAINRGINIGSQGIQTKQELKKNRK